MMQPTGKLSPLPRRPIKSNQERKRREKKKIATCRQHQTRQLRPRYAKPLVTSLPPLAEISSATSGNVVPLDGFPA